MSAKITKRFLLISGLLIIALLLSYIVRDGVGKIPNKHGTSHEIVIYSIKECPYCENAMDFLQEMNLPFVIVDITFDDRVWENLKEETGITTVPYIFIDGQYIGGCSDMLALSDSGKLAEILK